MSEFTRRRALLSSSAIVASAFAGCTGVTDSTPFDGGTEETETAEASAAGVEELEERIDELERENDRLREQAEETPVNTSDIEAELAAEKEQAEELRERIDEKDESVEELEAELATREDRIEELKAGGDPYYDAETIKAAQEVMNEAKDAVVYFDIDIGDGFSSGGTGWFIDEHTIVTNGHVIEMYATGEAESMTIYNSDGEELTATIEGWKLEDSEQFNTWADIGIISVEETASTTLDTAPSSSVRTGDPLIQVGHPSFIGNWVGALGEKLTPSSISDFSVEIPSKSGNSGSPMMNLNGDVVGCTYASSPQTDLNERSGAPRTDITELYTSYPYRESESARVVKIEAIEAYYNELV